MSLYDDVVAVVAAAGFTIIDPAGAAATAYPFVSVKYAGGEMDADSRWPRHAVEVGLYAALETNRNAHSMLAEHQERLVKAIVDNLMTGNIVNWTEARYGQDEGDAPSPDSPVYSVIRIEE